MELFIVIMVCIAFVMIAIRSVGRERERQRIIEQRLESNRLRRELRQHNDD